MSEVYRVNRNSESTVPCSGTPLPMTGERHCPSVSHIVVLLGSQQCRHCVTFGDSYTVIQTEFCLNN